MSDNVTTEIKEIQDQIAGSLAAFQTELKSLKASAVTNERLEGLKKEFMDNSDKLQNLAQAMEAEKKARETLELGIARIQGGSGEFKISSPGYEKAYALYLRKNQPPVEDVKEEEFKALLNFYKLENIPDEQKSGVKMLLAGSFPDGGLFVPVAYQSDIQKRVFETSPVRSLARVITIGTGEASFPIDDELWETHKSGELDARKENTKTGQFGEIKIPVHRHTAQPWVTQDMLEDSVFPVESYLNERVAEQFTRMENKEFVKGSGNKEALGFLTLPAWTTAGQYERGKLEYRSTTNTGLFDEPNDLIDLQSDLLEDFQGNATWAMHRKIWAACMKLRNTDKTYLLNPVMLFSGAAPQLLGRPVRMFGDLDSTIATGKKIIVYGDFRSAYCIVDRLGITLIRDNITRIGFVKYNVTKRTGGGVLQYQALKILKVK